MDRAFSTLEIKSSSDEGVIVGIASTPSLDRAGDMMLPTGAEYVLPLPLLWQHDQRQPLGEVTSAKVTQEGIEITAKIFLGVTAEIDRVWQMVKSGLVRGLSIGYVATDDEYVPNARARLVKAWKWLELSVVTIPCNAEATIATVKHFAANPAASGVAIAAQSPGVTGSVTQTKGVNMTIAERIAALESKRAAHSARMLAIMQKSADEGRQTEQAEQEEFDGLQAEIDAIDGDLKRFRVIEKAQVSTARPVTGQDAHGAAIARQSGLAPVQVKAAALDKGIPLAQLMKVKFLAVKSGESRLDIARSMYGENSQIVGLITKAAVPAGTTQPGNWASDLVLTEGGAFADFLDFLRPQTIVGKFGVGGIPSLRRVPFNVALGIQTTGGAGYWVGEGKPIPVTAQGFDRTGLSPMKVAALAVTSQELLRNASAAADAMVRDDLAKAVIARMDKSFIDPAAAGAAGVSPASITNGVTGIASTGQTAAEIREDVRLAMTGFVAAENTLSSGVWIMGAGTALALMLMRNDLGQREFPDVTLTGGNFEGLPVIVSNFVTAETVTLLSANDIYFADDGAISVETSTEASIEMLNASLLQDAGTGDGAELVSMFQSESAAFKAVRSVSWKKARAGAAALITGAKWGQPEAPSGG